MSNVPISLDENEKFLREDFLSMSMLSDFLKDLIPSEIKIIGKGRWQWQSNPNPYSKSEKLKWEFYSLEHNYLLEKAYYEQQQKEIELGDYVISIKHMIQMKKGNPAKQRPIRRIDWKDNVEETERSQRYLETELPKTVNRVFGSLEHFISFFSKRNPEILDFACQFEEIEKSNDLKGLNKGIVPKLVYCLEEELLKSILVQLQDSAISGLKKQLLLKIKDRHEELVAVFKKEFTSFRTFYEHILRAYTMNTDLYANLNKYLRNESWTAIDNLLPYAVCLCRTFFHFESHSHSNEDSEWNLLQPLFEKTNPMILYRGTAFDEPSLSFYQNAEITQQHFSWNSVTSTSTNKEVAEAFMYSSADVGNQKNPVLFIIQIPPTRNPIKSEYLKWIDIHQYSAIPKEDEVVLAPGSVFKLMKCSTDESNRTIIHLKLKNEIKSLAHEGLMMHGALQNEMMTNKKTMILCLEGEELLDSLKCLAGNTLIEKVQFCLCTFNSRSFEVLIEVLSTLERTKAVKFISCLYKDKEKVSSGKWKEFKSWNLSKIKISEMNHFYEVFIHLNENEKCRVSLSEFSLNFGNTEKTKDGQIDNRWRQELKHLTPLTSLTLDFERSEQLINEELKGLASQTLGSLSNLTSLTMIFSSCYEIADEAINCLANQGLQHLTKLVSLTLDFKWCDKITNEGVKSLSSKALQFLTQLTSLTLSFYGCREITNEGVRILVNPGLERLTQLTSLNLSFSDCHLITDEGVRILAFQGLQFLTELTTLNLSFSFCKKITNEGVRILVNPVFRHLTKLTALTLSFEGCSEISDEGAYILAFQGLQFLTELTTLNLSFSYCNRITDKGVRELIYQGSEHLAKLTVLDLDLRHSAQVSEEVKKLAYQRLNLSTSRLQSERRIKPASDLYIKTLFLRRVLSKHKKLFSQKKSPTLPLRNCAIDILVCLSSFLKRNRLELTASLPKSETNEGFRKANVPRNLPQLIPLTLLFRDDMQIENEVVKNLASQGLRYLIGLISLTLNFNQSNQLTDEEVKSLSYHELQHLPQLTSLTLNFSGCNKISDQGIQSLAFQGLYHLSQLTTLTLDFVRCHGITDEGIEGLVSLGLQHLTQLKTLVLNFADCSQITDEGINHLAFRGLRNLTQLESLTLGFYYNKKLTEKGLSSLASKGLAYLEKLVFLSIDFNCCSEITDEGIRNLSSYGLLYLTQLASLTLNFSECSKITDEGVSYLASQGLRHLSQLTFLRLDFYSCDNLTDEGVNSLMTHGLKHLTNLKNLALSLEQCHQITRFTIANILRILSYFGFSKSYSR